MKAEEARAIAEGNRFNFDETFLGAAVLGAIRLKAEQGGKNVNFGNLSKDDATKAVSGLLGLGYTVTVKLVDNSSILGDEHNVPPEYRLEIGW